MTKIYEVKVETKDKKLALNLAEETRQILAGWKRKETVCAAELQCLCCSKK